MDVRNRLGWGVSTGLLAALMSVSPVAAQQTEQTTSADGGAVQLAPITVEGQAQKPVPVTQEKTVVTTRTTRQELDAAQVDDVHDIDRLAIPGVNYSEANNSFNIRGLDRNRVLTTVDGIRLPWIESGAREGVEGGVSGFDFNSLSALDVIKSSDSSLFGAGALGGVVALRTINPEDLIDGTGKNWGGISKATFDSKDMSFGADQAFAVRQGNTYMLLQGGWRGGDQVKNEGDVGGYGADRTMANPQDYTQTNLLAKIRHHVDGGHVFGITGEMFNRKDEIEDKTSDPSDYENPDRDQIERRQRISAEYEYDGGGWLDAANAVLYWQRQLVEDDFSATRLSGPAGDYRRDNEREETTYGLAGSLTKSISTGSLLHKLSLGGEIFGSSATSYSEGEDNCGPGPWGFGPLYSCNFLHTNQADMPEVKGTTLGLFAQDEIGFFGDRVRVTPGVRYDWYEQKPHMTAGYEDNPNYTGDLPDSSSDGEFSPKLRIEFDPVAKVTLYAQWAQGFRAPSANELYLTYGSPGTYLSIGNPDLKPETSNGYEVGAILGDEWLGGTVSGFYNRYKNFLDDVAVSEASLGIPAGTYPFGVTQTINRAHVEIYGFEATAHFKHASGIHGWGTFGTYVGRDMDEDVHLNSIPAIKGVIGLGYATTHWGVDTIVTLVGAREKAEDEDHETESYETVDLTAWWRPTRLGTSGGDLTLRVGVYNLFDKKYIDPLDLPDSLSQPRDYYTQPGRTFKASATYRF